MLGGLEDALCDALGQERLISLDVHADDNVELVSRLLADLREGQENAIPGALVLPPGSAEDSLRWLQAWPELGPPEALDVLGLSRRAEWKQVLEAAYARFSDHWAAGVAYHH